MDFNRYNEWNPCVEQATPQTPWSTRWKLRVRRPGGRSVALGATIDALRHDPRVIAWSGAHPLRGLVTVTYAAEVISREGGGTRLEQSAEVAGFLQPRAARAAQEMMAATAAALSRAAARATPLRAA